MTVIHLIAVGAGGFLGAISRYYIAQKLNKTVEENHLPVGTLLVNLIGSFLLGFIVSVGVDGLYILVIGTGFLGAFTTFSTFNKELYTLKKFPGKWFSYFSYTYVGGILVWLTGLFIWFKYIKSIP